MHRRRTPAVNTRWDEKAQEIIQSNYVNLGIAIASAGGLVVPNIKDAERMSLCELVGALATLTETSRAGKATLSLAFDDRLVDNEQCSRFLTDVGTTLSGPAQVLTMV